MANPFRSVLIVIAFFAVLFWVLSRIVGNDVRAAQQSQSEWREYKGKNGRLD
jgi:flagellar biogenesis protein FliO